MTNLEVVKQCYEKFKQGDLASLLAMFDPHIEFRLAEGHPYQVNGKPWVGGQEITRHFFAKAGTEWENRNVLLGDTLEANDAVVVESRYAGVYKPTGRTLDIQACHVWRLRNGKVVSFHQYIDTARLQKVMGYAD
jgi:ketosteroid isomerase-like protein